MSPNPIAEAAAELNATAAAHAPADMWAVARELDDLADVDGYTATALRTYTRRLSGEYPIHPSVVEALEELAADHDDLTRQASEIAALFRRVHETDLRRGEAPRTNEQAWNVDGSGGPASPTESGLCPGCPADCPRRQSTT